jgi:hypothetical protein
VQINSTTVQRAWLMLAVGDDREHGGNDGYDDDPSTHYSWDDTVGNHAAPQRGDVIVLWDKKSLLGASVIENVQQGQAEKPLFRCPRCQMAGIKARKTLKPRYRCDDCGHLFDEPLVLQRTVTTYRTRHDIAWVDLNGQLTGSQLRSLCVHPESQLSLRPLDYERFHRSVTTVPQRPRLSTVESRLDQLLSGGHRTVVVRARVGQGAFRSRLLARYGDVCAFTGPTPRDALEAAHLYSYATSGEHHDDGGLLMRRDVHRLFDVGHLAVHPERGTIDVAPSVRGYDQYGPLHDRTLHLRLTDDQRRWVGLHWAIHRT